MKTGKKMKMRKREKNGKKYKKMGERDQNGKKR